MTIDEVLEMIEKQRQSEHEDFIDDSTSFAMGGPYVDPSRHQMQVDQHQLPAIAHTRAAIVLGNLAHDIKKRMEAEEEQP